MPYSGPKQTFTVAKAAGPTAANIQIVTGHPGDLGGDAVRVGEVVVIHARNKFAVRIRHGHIDRGGLATMV